LHDYHRPGQVIELRFDEVITGREKVRQPLPGCAVPRVKIQCAQRLAIDRHGDANHHLGRLLPAELDLVVGALHDKPQGDALSGCQQIVAGSPLQEAAARDGGELDLGSALEPFRQDQQLRPVLGGHEAALLGNVDIAVAQDTVDGRDRRQQDDGHQQPEDQHVYRQAAQAASQPA
jgi:hypothetical protein